MGRTGGQLLSSAKFSFGIGQIWMDNVQCSGNESRLDQCEFGIDNHGWGQHNCRHYEDVGISCGKETCESIAHSQQGIRLVHPDYIALPYSAGFRGIVGKL